MGIWDWLSGHKENQPGEPGVAPLHLARGRGFTFEVVGETIYQDALNAICGGKCEDGHKLPTTAQLCFDEGNAHDRNAIVVLIGGRTVGYVPRDLAPGMCSAILRLNPEKRPITCDAKVVGGWMREGGDEGHYGVKLSLSDPLRATPPT